MSRKKWDYMQNDHKYEMENNTWSNFRKLLQQ